MAFLGVVYSPETIASTTISQLGVDIDGVAAGDQSGSSVSLSADGGRLAIGARKHDGARGHVRIYDLISGTWTQVGADIDGEAAGDESGSSVSLSEDGSRVAIGARKNDGSFLDAGHVRIYDLIAGTWTQVGADINGERLKDESGFSVSLSADGTHVAIGALYNDDTGSNAGQVRIYDLISGTWTQVGADIDGEAAGDESGNSVSLSEDGSRVAIGALYNDETGDQAGHVRIYDFIAGTWTQVGADIDGEAAGDNSGVSVSLSSSGSRLAIGARYNDGTASKAGHVRIYDLIAGTWTQVGADINGEAANDYSGASVSLSSSGSRVAIGAVWNDGTASKAGHVRIYDWNGTAWTKGGNDIDGEAAGDESGNSVSLSGDGNRVGIAAWLNDDGGSDAGHTRIFSLSSPALTPTFGTATKTADGLTVSITNYDAAFTFGTPTVDNGSVTAATADGTNQLLTVTDLTPGQSVTITQTTTRTGYFSGSATFT
jgi:Flp pilus assembly pilin Flp